MKKIVLTVIGGGSVNWMKRLMRDLYLVDELEGGEIRLVDPNLKHARAVADMLRRFNYLRGKEYFVRATDNRRDALPGSDFVMTTFSPGTMEGFDNDLELPAKYGIRLPVSMTVGIPGISAAIRTIPVAYEIVKDMEELCPGAWLLNVTNPMSTVVGAMNRAAKSTKIVGLCHEFHCLPECLGPALGLERPEGVDILDYVYRWLPEQGFDYTVAGINHFIWLTRATWKGEDVLPRIRAFAQSHMTFREPEKKEIVDVYANNGEVKLMLCRQLGYLPLAGDRHLVEFHPSLCNVMNGYGMKYGVRKTTVDLRRANIRASYDEIVSVAKGDTDMSWERSDEEMTEIMRAIVTGGSTVGIVNAPNAGQIENMPEGSIVETLATIDRSGVHPHASGILPGAVGSMCRLHSDVQQMVIDAALAGDRTLLLEAMSLDPSSAGADFAAIPALMEELLDANRKWLPRFF